MLFTSFEFVAFLACVLVLYYLIPVRFQWILLLVANVFFYARSGLYGLMFMGVTIVASYSRDPRVRFSIWMPRTDI